MTALDLLNKLYLPYIDKHPNLEIPIHCMNEYQTFFEKEYELHGKAACSYAKRVFLKNYIKHTNIDEYHELRNYVLKLYEDEYGLKEIAKMLNMSYSGCRSLFKYLEIDFKKGRSVVTNRLREFRKQKANLELLNGTGWFSDETRSKLQIINSTSRGVQGYYYSTYNNKYVWLRSTYEYIYAKWLDSHKFNWDVECKVYKLKNTNYTPDFFIFNCDGKLTNIIEIKGFWRNREYKAYELNEMLNIEVSLINDITPYLEESSTYSSELKKWKKIRILKLIN